MSDFPRFHEVTLKIIVETNHPSVADYIGETIQDEINSDALFSFPAPVWCLKESIQVCRPVPYYLAGNDIKKLRLKYKMSKKHPPKKFD